MSENYESRDVLSEDDQLSYDRLIENGYESAAVLKYLENADEDFDNALDELYASVEKQGDEDVGPETELSVEPEDDTPTEPAPIEPAPTDSEKSADIFSLIDEELNK